MNGFEAKHSGLIKIPSYCFVKVLVTPQFDTAAQMTDPLEMPRGPITRARAKKFKEALLNLMKTNYLKDFEDDEMKEGTSHRTYAGMTIVVHED